MPSDSRVYLIAEAGVNHNGDLGLALQLIDAAAEAGADAVKFQTFRSELVISRHAPKAEYQMRATGGEESQLDMVRRLELSEQDHDLLAAHARSRGIDFLSTPFDLPSLQLLTRRLSLTRIKIPSGEITNLPFLLDIARASPRVILSTGMATLAEVETALGVLAFGYTATLDAAPSLTSFASAFAAQEARALLAERVVILHCTTEYPAPVEETNLRAMDTIASAFGLPVGYSDHTEGIHVALAAVARGASLIEKHFTLDRSMEGPDHRASIEPSTLAELVQQVRDIERALGDGVKVPGASEWKNRAVARKSIVARRRILPGELFSEENLICKRPGSGVSASRWYDLLGRRAAAGYLPDDLIQE